MEMVKYAGARVVESWRVTEYIRRAIEGKINQGQESLIEIADSSW